jgi:hypothetical protein
LSAQCPPQIIPHMHHSVLLPSGFLHMIVGS